MNKLLTLLLGGAVLANLGTAYGQVLTGPRPIVPVPNHNVDKPLSGAEQKKHFVLPPGFEIELVAAEPDIINPITMALDDKGRLYVSESHTYRYGPSGSPIKPFLNPVVRLDPLPGGGVKRTVVADGFEDPIMGILIRGNTLWLTANNFLYQYDLDDDGKATKRRTMLTDKNKTANPFGMFDLKWGLDGQMYMSVGNHWMDINGPNNKVVSRGASGIVSRMKPDGSDLERLVHGLRVPYAFDYDPFGQLWILSNGEGSPDRFVRVIEGVDYHCYSRDEVGYAWLAGEHPLAPPCFEPGRGASTQMLRYYGAGFPAEYQGSVLSCNWGAHGYNGPNRAVLRYVPDAHGLIARTEGFVSCADPLFRPSHILVDRDGSLLICDWYGRDDESDLTGRVWRVKYTGKDKPAVEHQIDTLRWSEDDYLFSALGSPNHLVRVKAMDILVARGPKAIAQVAEQAGKAKTALGGADALWTLVRIGTPEAKAALAAGTKHADWNVRRLALRLLRRYEVPGTADIAKTCAGDTDPAVRLEAALAQGDAVAKRTALVAALKNGGASEAHLRYEAAWHLAKVVDKDTLDSLVKAESTDLRLAGLIVIDVACYEKLPSKDIAVAVLARELVEPSHAADLDHLLTLARLNWDPALVPGLTKLLAREDLPAAEGGRVLLLLRSRSVKLEPTILQPAVKRLLDAVDKGTIRLSSPTDAAVYLDFLESEGPIPAGLKQLSRLILDGPHEARPLAHALARKFGPKASTIGETLWPRLLDIHHRDQDRVELLATMAMIDANPKPENWRKLLSDKQTLVQTEAIRSWRAFKGNKEMTDLLIREIPGLTKASPALGDELAVVLTALGEDPTKAGPTKASKDRDALAADVLTALPKLSGEEREKRTRVGRLVFERSACAKCHTTVNQDTPLAPSLKAVAKGQKVEYLIESVLYPSKVIKTGFETELIVTKKGKTYTGLVKDDGKMLRVLNLDKEEHVAKSDIDERSVQKISIMPEGQEKQMSPGEFLDLIVYLQSLR